MSCHSGHGRHGESHLRVQLLDGRGRRPTIIDSPTIFSNVTVVSHNTVALNMVTV
jgi:hypothetical protein